MHRVKDNEKASDSDIAAAAPDPIIVIPAEAGFVIEALAGREATARGGTAIVVKIERISSGRPVQLSQPKPLSLQPRHHESSTRRRRRPICPVFVNSSIDKRPKSDRRYREKSPGRKVSALNPPKPNRSRCERSAPRLPPSTARPNRTKYSMAGFVIESLSDRSRSRTVRG